MNKIYNIQYTSLKRYCRFNGSSLTYSHDCMQYTNVSIEKNVFSFIGSLGVDIFFCMSGFIMVLVTKGKSNGISASLDFLLKRLKRIYPMYWIYTLIAIIVLGPSKITSNLFEIVFLLPQSNTVLNVAWSLVYELYFYLIFSLLMLLDEKKLLLYCFVWGIAIILSNIFFTIVTNPYLEVFTSPFSIEFILGIMLGKFYFKFDQVGKKGLYVILLVLFLLTVLGNIFGSYFQGWEVHFLHKVTLSLFLIYLFIFAEYLNIIGPNWLIRIGDMSYGIYLTHFLQFIVIARISKILNVDNIYLIASVMLASSLVYGHLNYRFIEAPLISRLAKPFRLEKKYLNIGEGQ